MYKRFNIGDRVLLLIERMIYGLLTRFKNLHRFTSEKKTKRFIAVEKSLQDQLTANYC